MCCLVRDHNIRDRDFMIVDSKGRSHTMVRYFKIAKTKVNTKTYSA